MKNFEKGDLWISPRGFIYEVICVVNNQALLKSSGCARKIRRSESATKNWTLKQGEDFDE